jgi:peptidoglycan/LPS O-acetylase OafA/YrhL
LRYHCLDAIRGLASVCVVLFHLGLIWHVMPYGYLAVDVFFALSGYVMAMTYEPALRAGMTARAFLLGRWKRLFPVWLVGSTLGVAVLFAKAANGQGWPASPSVALNVLMLPAFVGGGDIYPLNVPGWSLGFEWLAYLGFAVRSRIDSSTLGLIAVVSAAILLGHGGIPNAGSEWSEFPLGLARLGFAFPLGWLLWRWRWRPPQLPEIWQPVAGWLGRVSYPLYVVHYPLLSPLQLAARKIGISGPLPAIAIVALLLGAAHVVAQITTPTQIRQGA